MSWMGVLNICKIPGMSSHDVVSRVRRLAGMKRVGHAGTLDPAACGVLLVCVGRATRLADYLAGGCKGYRAEITFGVVTDSADADGQVTRVCDARAVREEDVLALLPRFSGLISQRPPAHSAVQIGGRRAYDLARQGIEVDMPVRQVSIFAFTPVRFLAGRHPRLLADIACSKGTYIRSLAHDLGEELGVGATLTFLARTGITDCLLHDAVTLEELAHPGRFAAAVQSPDVALAALPAWTLPPDDAGYRHGSAVACTATPGIYRVYQDARFLGLGRCADQAIRPLVNLFPG